MNAFRLLLLIICGLSVSASAEVRYTVTDLGTLGGTSSSARGINDLGQVAGGAKTTDGNSHAFLWTPGVGMQDLGTLGGSESLALDLNDSGQVVGWAQDASDACEPVSWRSRRAFLWTSSEGMQELQLGPAGGYTSASGINEAGQIIADDGSTDVLWEDGVASPLYISPLEVTTLRPVDINNTGQVLGFVGADGVGIWEDGNASPIGYGWYPAAINDLGQVAGHAAFGPYIADGVYHAGGDRAVLWTDGFMEELGSLGSGSSRSEAINDSGHVVGQSDTVWDASAFLWTREDGMRDLNLLIDPSSGWVLSYASAINEAGQIAGGGINPAGKGHAYLLTPVPWPPIVGDVDRSGYVDDDDLSILLANWGFGTEWGQGDLDGSGTVDDDDLSLLLANWGAGCPPTSQAIPEPATLALLAVGGLALIRGWPGRRGHLLDIEKGKRE